MKDSLCHVVCCHECKPVQCPERKQPFKKRHYQKQQKNSVESLLAKSNDNVDQKKLRKNKTPLGIVENDITDMQNEAKNDKRRQETRKIVMVLKRRSL